MHLLMIRYRGLFANILKHLKKGLIVHRLVLWKLDGFLSHLYIMHLRLDES